jgi:hypothetical protein
MGEVITVNFRAGRKFTGFLPAETGKVPHRPERQGRFRELFGFARSAEPAIICRPECFGPDDCL